MITKKDAILIAQTFAKAAKIDIEIARASGLPELIPAIRGAFYRGLDELWYDVLPLKVRDQFEVVSNVKSGKWNFSKYVDDILDL